MGTVIQHPNFSGIPSHVQALDRWIVWRLEMRLNSKGEEVETKVPYRTGGDAFAKTDDRKTWATYARTKSYFLGHKDEYSGIGFCRDEEHIFIDLDNCLRDLRPEDERQDYACEKYGKTFAHWDWDGLQPEEIYNRLVSAGAWIEISAMGYGLHAVIRSSAIVASFQRDVPGKKHTGFALYASQRYLTVTGALLWEGDLSIDNHELAEAMSTWVPQRVKTAAPAVTPDSKVNTGAQESAAGAASFALADMSDEAVLKRLLKSRKGKTLWSGNDPGDLGDNSHSGLDFALCQALAFWCRKDAAQMDRLFRDSALYLDREEKWERVGAQTISRAIDMQTDVWEPRPRSGTGRAGASFAEEARRVKAKIAAQAGKETEEERKESGKETEEPETGGSPDEPPPGAWKKLLKRGRGGVVLACHFNADLALRWSPEWREADLVLDEFANVIRSRGPMPWGGKVKSWTDADSVRAAIWMQSHDLPVTPGIMSDVVHAWADEHRVHPLREWLQGLRWDGEPRIDRWLTAYLGAEENTHNCLAGAWWLGGAVARAFVPGAKVDYVLVLEGEQGLLKSTALRVLVGDEWFSDSVSSFSGKDSAIDCQGKWVMELGEIDKLAENPSVIKAFLSRVTDHFRPPYEKHSRDFPRQTVFAGTVNLEEYLSDSSGNRRFWPVKCTKLDLDALARDREQLWAEATERYSSNKAVRWPSTPDEIRLFMGEAAKREDIDVWHDTIRRWVAKPAVRYERQGTDGLQPVGDMDSTAEAVIASEVLLHACGITIDKQTPALKKRVGMTMRRLGWKPGMAGDEAQRYRVWLRPEDTGLTVEPDE